MVQPAQNRDGCDSASFRVPCIGSVGNLLPQSLVRPRFVAVARAVRKPSTQMLIVQNDEVTVHRLRMQRRMDTWRTSPCDDGLAESIVRLAHRLGAIRGAA